MTTINPDEDPNIFSLDLQFDDLESDGGYIKNIKERVTNWFKEKARFEPWAIGMALFMCLLAVPPTWLIYLYYSERIKPYSLLHFILSIVFVVLLWYSTSIWCFWVTFPSCFSEGFIFYNIFVYTSFLIAASIFAYNIADIYYKP